MFRSTLLALSSLAIAYLTVALEPVSAQAAKAEPAPPNPLVEQLKTLGLAEKPFTLIVEIEIKPESVKKVEALMLTAATNTHKEPGCLMYDIHRDPNAPGKYVFLERFNGIKALEAHLAPDYTKNLLAAFGSESAGPPSIRIISQFSPTKK